MKTSFKCKIFTGGAIFMHKFFDAAPNFRRRDVFNSEIVKGAEYDNDIPIIKTSDELPNQLIPFSKANSTDNYNQWVCFYEDDYKFERLWNNPKHYLGTLKKFRGVISPDFSLYRDLPYPIQLYNLYRSRAIGSWLQSEGIKVIPNIRWGGKLTYYEACLGVEKNKTIAVGTHGNIKDMEDRQWLNDGLDTIIKILTPKNIVLYGATPPRVTGLIRMQGINIMAFESHSSRVYKEKKENGNG